MRATRLHRIRRVPREMGRLGDNERIRPCVDSITASSRLQARSGPVGAFTKIDRELLYSATFAHCLNAGKLPVIVAVFGPPRFCL